MPHSPSTPLRRAGRAFLPAVMGLLLPALVAAQDLGRKYQAEVSASLFFGNTRQTLAAVRAGYSRVDSTLELRTEGRFNYGRATDDQGETFVSNRSWVGSVTADLRPFDRVSPFGLFDIESSLEKRIDLRTAAGLGAKLTVLRREGAVLDVSLAALGERTIVPDTIAGTSTRTLARWSARLRGERTIQDRLTLSSETWYRPVIGALGEFTLTSTNSLGYELTEHIALRISFIDSYDSEAVARGARSNNDGRIVVGVLTTL